MIVWKRGRRDASRASTGAKRFEVTDRPNQARLSERVDASTDREREGTSCWDRYVAMSRRQSGGPRPYRVRPRAARQDPPSGHHWSADTARADRVATVRGADGSRLDYYTLLGVDRTATEEQLKRVYRQHVVTIHPDRFFNDPVRHALAQKKLKALNVVMQVLRDRDHRARYDASLAGDRLRTTPLLSRLGRTTGS
jgi:hypothetical protein